MKGVPNSSLLSPFATDATGTPVGGGGAVVSLFHGVRVCVCVHGHSVE